MSRYTVEDMSYGKGFEICDTQATHPYRRIIARVGSKERAEEIAGKLNQVDEETARQVQEEEHAATLGKKDHGSINDP